jgi:hypothetical protein
MWNKMLVVVNKRQHKTDKIEKIEKIEKEIGR